MILNLCAVCDRVEIKMHCNKNLFCLNTGNILLFITTDKLYCTNIQYNLVVSELRKSALAAPCSKLEKIFWYGYDDWVRPDQYVVMERVPENRNQPENGLKELPKPGFRVLFVDSDSWLNSMIKYPSYTLGVQVRNMKMVF